MANLIIDDKSLATGILHRESGVINSTNFWHKVFVKNAQGCSRDSIYKTLMKFVYPHDFIPVCFKTEEDGQVSFLLKNCGSAIDDFGRKVLMIPNPEKGKNALPFKLTIQLRFAHASELKIDIQTNIIQVLKRRFNASNKTLNLEQFHKDSDLVEFCPLCQPKLFSYVLHLSRDYDIDTLKLSNNEIEKLKPLEVYLDRGNKAIKTIDLRKNNVKSLESLVVLKNFPVEDLWLEENPIVDDYSEYDYLKTVRNICPKLLRLDGVRLPPPGTLLQRRNYLCNNSVQDLVDRFLEHYFTLFDSIHREVLQNVYHKNAIFTLTQCFLTGQVTSVSTKLQDFKKFSRNIKQISDFSKCTDMLHVGPVKIINVLLTLPPTEHDPYTFTVDVTFHNDKMTVVVVTGVFKQPAANLLDPDYIYGFTRTFVLTPGVNGEFTISNEQLHVFNATTSGASRAFKVVRVARPLHITVPIPKTMKEREELVSALSLLTEMKRPWAKKCLQECEYDIKKALNLFMLLFKEEKLPSHAFNFKDPSGRLLPECQDPLPPALQQLPVMTQTVQQHMQQQPMMQPVIPPAPVIQPVIQPAPVPTPLLQTGASSSKTGEVRDQILASAFSIEANTPRGEIKLALEKAARRILDIHTYCLQYYRKLGTQFYKHDFAQEARTFFTEGITKVPTHMTEKLKMEFILCEAELGDWNIAEMKLLTLMKETSSIPKIINFVYDDLGACNLHGTRSLFKKLILNTVSDTTKQSLINALKSYEVKHQAIFKAKDHEPARELVSRIDQLYEISDEDNEVIPKGLKQEHTKLDFWEFRSKLLQKVGLYSMNIIDPDITKLQEKEMAIDETNNICERVMQKHRSEFGVLRLVCKKYWSLKLFPKIREMLVTYKKFNDEKLVNNLIILYKLKTDANNDKWKNFNDKARTHINTCEITQLLNFLEDCIQEDAQFARGLFLGTMNDPKIDVEKQKIITLLFKTYAILSDNTEALEAATKAGEPFANIPCFHNSYYINEESLQQFMLKYKNPEEIITMQHYLEPKDFFIQVLQATLAMYRKGQAGNARTFRNLVFQKLPIQNRSHYSILTALYELRYGEQIRAKKYLEKMPLLYQDSPSLLGAKAECLVHTKKYGEAATVLQPILDERLKIMNPDVQKLLYTYIESWKADHQVDILEMLKQLRS